MEELLNRPINNSKITHCFLFETDVKYNTLGKYLFLHVLKTEQGKIYFDADDLCAYLGFKYKEEIDALKKYVKNEDIELFKLSCFHNQNNCDPDREYELLYVNENGVKALVNASKRKDIEDVKDRIFNDMFVYIKKIRK